MYTYGSSPSGHFQSVPQAAIGRSVFNRSHGHKTAFMSDVLVPFYVDEVLPGDTFNVKVNVFARLATPLVPVMDNISLDMFFFFVPNRLIWDNWQKFMGERLNPSDSTSYLVPQIVTGGTTMTTSTRDLYSYMGVPITNSFGPAGTLAFNNLHGRAYNLIWNEYFRDQNLQTRVVVDKGDGPDSEANYKMLSRCKRPDYFTTCLPWPQKDAGVTIPIAADDINVWSANTDIFLKTSTQGGGQLKAGTATGGMNPVMVDFATDASLGTALQFGTSVLNPGLEVRLEPSSGTINSLRQAYQIQRLLERDARGGTRYIELLKSHFGVTSPDFRLQRPEYLGGGSIPVVVHSVPQTSGSGTGADTPQGNVAGYGVAASRRNGFVKSFVEHGVLIGLITVRADITYQQGLNRMWSRRTKFDYYWPAFAHLGEQAVLNKEIFAIEDSGSSNELVFGYQERWAEYRYKPSMVSNVLNSRWPTSIDIWHLAEEFPTLPVLNDSFIKNAPPIDRLLAVSGEPHFVADCWFDIKAARPLPVYGVPGLSDHF